MPRRPDDEATHRADHQHKTECVPDEPWHADHHPTEEDNQSIEQLPGRHLSASQSLSRVRQHAQADAPDDKGPERAHEEEDRQRPEQADLLTHNYEGGDLGGEGEQCADEEHDAR